ncbi:hypothetical protein GCM10009122_40450 [Fulvivirga kasyanovii]|uniref:hypothetical protein n=1 Tax=Fulvivirga kasyanovii TaxID=396812 RepID=UPI0031D0BBD8
MNRPKLYVFDGFPVKGELGDNTRLEVREICEVCHRKDFIYHHLSYKFDEWDGEDVIKGVDFYLISEKLKKIFTEENIKGIGFQEIENEKSEFFKFSRNSYQKELPVFYK